MIYRDVLGRPNSVATVSIFGGVFEPTYYSLSHISDCPDRKWSGDTPAETIAAEMEADGWRCSIRRNGYNQPVIDCIHIETQAIIDAAKAAETAAFRGAARGFIRFGDIPEGGRSYNHRDNRPETGVSCFDAEFAADGRYRLILTPVLEVSFLAVADRPAYRLYGERIGTGADGEPLLTVSRATKL